MAAQRKFEAADVYPAARKKYLPITKHGSLLVASTERLRAKLADVEPDPTKIGASGDINLGAAAIAETLNKICFGTAPDQPLSADATAQD
jgi:hypothetical protein